MEYELDLQEVEKTKKLTPRQELFCQEFVSCLNQTLAYSRAYPDCSKEAARRAASKLMTNIDIQARVKELQKEQAERYQITPGFLIEKSMWVINKAMEGKEEVMLDKFGDVVKTGNKTYDHRAINDALKNIAAFTGLNVQTIKAQVDAKAEANVKVIKAQDIAKSILGEDDPEQEENKVDDVDA